MKTELTNQIKSEIDYLLSKGFVNPCFENCLSIPIDESADLYIDFPSCTNYYSVFIKREGLVDVDEDYVIIGFQDTKEMINKILNKELL